MKWLRDILPKLHGDERYRELDEYYTEALTGLELWKGKTYDNL